MQAEATRHGWMKFILRGLRLLADAGILALPGLLLCIAPHPAQAAGFSIIGTEPGAWPDILSSIGYRRSPAVDAQLFVGRPGAPASPNWSVKLASGCILVLEGESPLAASFGFRPGKETVRVASLQDVHRPGLPIIFEHALEVHRYDIPADAEVFATERWTSAPMVAGVRRGPGAILWVAADPGKSGYERFPYLLQSLTDLGMEPPFQSGRLWAFFDSAYRSHVDMDYLAARWRKSGIAAIHVAAWHFYEPDAERDAYLKTLIAACHKRAITVYAWIELPHVSERFWAEHPDWREKTAVGQDAQLDWRKLMNLTNRDCFGAVSAGVQDLVQRFDWDGVNMAELYFESLEGASNPARFTPMNADVRAMFRSQNGWDPMDIYADRKDAQSLRTFLDFRADLANRMQNEWLTEVEKCRSTKPDLDIVLTHVDDRFDAGMKDAIGADAGRVLPMLQSRDFTFLIEDPATVWNLGPQRYPEIAKRYQPINPRPDRLAIDINVVDRYQDVYPTKQQTGTELFQLVHLAAAAFPRVTLYFENSILRPDMALLPSAAAVVNRFEKIGAKTLIDAPYGVGIPWHGPALVDGKPWAALNDAVLWMPAGTHSVQPGATPAPVRVLDFNGTLEGVESSGHKTLITYRSSTRAIALLDRNSTRVDVDGAQFCTTAEQTKGGFLLLLPRGQHTVTVTVE